MCVRPSEKCPLPIRAEPAAVETGSVVKGATARGSFRLVNRSDHEVRIASTTSSCGCTTARAPKSLAPDASVEIPVTLSVSVSGESATVRQAVTIRLEGHPARPLLIPIRATVAGATPTPAPTDADTCKAP